MIIDAHAHMIDERSFDRLETVGGKWAKEGVGRARTVALRKPQYTAVGVRVEQLDRHDIDFQVVTPEYTLDSNLLPGDVQTQLAYSKVLNDSMAELVEASKGRLIAAGSVPMANFGQGGRRELERAINTLGLKAVSTVSNVNGKPLDSTEYDEFWAAIDEMGVPVYIHPNNPVGTAGRPYESDYDLVHNFGWPYETVLALARLVFSGVMERYPNLKIVAHHLGGGMIPFYLGRTLETYEPENQNLIYGSRIKSLPKPLFDYFSRFYYDTAVGGSAPAIMCAYNVFGADRLLFATDYPWGPGSGEFRLAEYPKTILSLKLPQEEERKIFADNVRLVLNLG